MVVRRSARFFLWLLIAQGLVASDRSNVMLILLSPFALRASEANCNVIPPATERVLPSTKGSVTIPIAAPGRPVGIRLTGCDASAGFVTPASANTVTLLFEPPSGSNTPVIVSALPDHLCVGGANIGQACTTDADCCTNPLACANSCADSVDECAGGGAPCNVLRFAVPLTESQVGTPTDGLTLTGPATITVTNVNGLVAQIDQLGEPTLHSACSQSVDMLFKKFTVLPIPNDAQALCPPGPGSPCTGTATRLLMTVDGDDSILIPLDYRGVLPLGPGAPVGVLMDASSTYPAFDDLGNPATISSALAARPNPSAFVRSFTIDGTELDPVLHVNNVGAIYGTADGAAGIIRIARDVGDGFGDLFDVTTRLESGIGPIKVNPAYSVNRRYPVPLQGLRSTGLAVGIARDESIEGADLNGDGDFLDLVPQVLDVATAGGGSTALAVARVSVGNSVRAVIETSGSLTAFLASEADQGPTGTDLNADGDKADTVLRVFNSSSVNVTGGTPITVTRTGLINGHALAISGPLVFFRQQGGANDLTFLERQSVVAVDIGIPQPAGIAVSPDGRHVYVSGSGGDLVNAFERAPTGKLKYVSSAAEGLNGVSGMDQATGIAVSPDGANVYVAGQQDNAVVVLRRDAATGSLSFVEAQFDNVGPVDGLASAFGVAVSPDGKHVYVTSGQGGDNAVAVFSRSASTGALTFVEAKFDGIGGVDGLNAAQGIAVSSDGAHVYVAGAIDNAVAVFSRNAGTGQLTFVEVQKQGIGGVDGLTTPNDVSVSPDGKNVYTKSGTDDAVAVFSRNPSTGQLTFIEAHKDGVGPVDGLNGAGNVAVTADGAYVIATGTTDNAVAIFERDPNTGALTYNSAKFNFVDGVSGIGGALAVGVSPDGAHVYVGGFADFAIGVFQTSGLQAALDTNTSTIRPVHFAPVRSGFVAVGGQRSLDMVSEGGLADFNSDGDFDDEVPFFYDGVTDTTAFSLGHAADQVAISRNMIAMRVPEAEDGFIVRNGDGDSVDTVIGISTTAAPGTVVFPLTGASAVVDTVGAIGATDLCSNGSNDQRGCESDADCPGGGTCSEGIVAFTRSESGTGLNPPDGDVSDQVVQFYRKSTGTVTNVGRSARDLSVGGHLIAFRTWEKDEGDYPAYTDLNSDGDTDDYVMQVYDLSTGVLTNTGQAAIPCILPACTFYPYKVEGDLVSFLSRETDQGKDLNRNGSATDTVVQVFNLKTRTSEVFDASGGGKTIDPFPTKFIDRSVIYVEVTEASLGRDVNEDGDLDDTVMLQQGDSDEDGTFDQRDTCIDNPNPGQQDADLDGLGDSACDATLYCDDAIPAAPPMAPPGAVQCQKAIGKAGRVYLKKRAAAVRACLTKIAEGQLSGDPTDVCRGRFVAGTAVAPSDAFTAAKLTKAMAKLQAIVGRSCETPLVSQLAACAGSNENVESCIEATYGASALAATDLAYGNLMSIADAQTRACQTALGGATAYLHKVVKAMQTCLDKLNRGVLSGDAQTLCLGSLTPAGVVLPTDVTANRQITAAKTALQNPIQNKCTPTRLASLDACGATPTDAVNCLSCAGWRGAMAAVQSAYGPR